MRISGPWFTLTFCVTYWLAMAMDAPLFLYYPMTREIHFAAAPGNAGPAMHWYGFMATAAIAALAVGVVCRTDWLSLRLLARLWLVPVAAIAAIGWGLRSFFG